jgi:putative ABC transport system permease protein
MLDVIAGGIGVLAGVGVLALCLAALLYLPVVLVRAVKVVLRREGIPASYTFRSLSRRKSSTAATFCVVALVTFVLTAVMMLGAGIQHTLEATGNPRNAKVFRDNTLSEWNSWLEEEQLQQLAATPGVARSSTGAPLVSGELVVLVWAGRAGSAASDDGANLTVRGVHPVAFDVHEVRELEGRRFATGAQEVVIGKALAGRFDGATLGGTITFAERSWTVVGVADHGGTAHDSEIWGDFEVLSVAFRRGAATATVALTEASALDSFSSALDSSNRQNQLSVKRETAYWRALSESYVDFVTLLGCVMAFVFAFGAILGALNTMYAQVAARTRELGALRAIGFKPNAVLICIVFESVCLAVAAGAVGVLGAGLLDSSSFTLTTAQTLSEITYHFQLSPALALGALGGAALMGYAGGLLPGLRAARMPITAAVRAE